MWNNWRSWGQLVSWTSGLSFLLAFPRHSIPCLLFPLSILQRSWNKWCSCGWYKPVALNVVLSLKCVTLGITFVTQQSAVVCFCVRIDTGQILLTDHLLRLPHVQTQAWRGGRGAQSLRRFHTAHNFVSFSQEPCCCWLYGLLKGWRVVLNCTLSSLIIGSSHVRLWWYSSTDSSFDPWIVLVLGVWKECTRFGPVAIRDCDTYNLQAR